MSDFTGPGFSHAGHPGFLPIPDQKTLNPECFRVLSLTSHFRTCSSGEVQVEVCGKFLPCRHCGISSSGREVTGGADIPESISTSKFHFVPRASTVSRRLHCSPGGFLRTDLHSSKPCFVPTRCSSDDASRPHQQPLIHLFVSWLLALRDLGSTRIQIPQTCTKVIHERTNPA